MRRSSVTDRMNYMNTQETNQQDYSIKDMQDALQTRMQKITTALYLVSDLISDKEPLKARLRNLSVQTLAKLGQLALVSPSQGKRLVTEIQNLLDQAGDTLSVCVAVGFVSDMNFKLLSSAVTHLRDDLNQKFALLNSSDAHKASFLNRAVEEFVLPADLLEQDTSTDKTILKDKQKNNFKGQTKMSSYTEGSSAPQKNSPKQPADKKASPSSDNVKSLERERAVLDFIQSRQEEVSVGQVASLFPETSEKTIQRLLVKMVEDGALTKTGEKRWSRYHISRAQQ